MASFLYKLTNPGKAPIACGTASFPDVPQGSTFCGVIGWLDGEAVTGGYADGGFHPTAAVSRQAMAAFLYKLVNPTTPAPACPSAPFADVPTTSQFCGAITWLVGRGVTGGYTDGGFHPAAAVSRQAMAAFLHRLDPDLTLRAGYVVFGAGTFRIGTDITAGTYRTRHASPEVCYWERLKGFSGSLDDIIANNLTTAPDVVTIGGSDVGFKADDCAVWT
ncbi:MAG TPA: S-layer homology domain-containing protein, partial [Mycobacteriales bacterium]|nr:S-layer homology domain-containing protein [Mycobacteriales bacterium]